VYHLKSPHFRHNFTDKELNILFKFAARETYQKSKIDSVVSTLGPETEVLRRNKVFVQGILFSSVPARTMQNPKIIRFPAGVTVHLYIQKISFSSTFLFDIYIRISTIFEIHHTHREDCLYENTSNSANEKPLLKSRKN
jgi:hypothetical protein